ncbi:MAG: LON peptidase substrate-binding domain-containing protein, partial [Candidatus Hydrogenedens sp.]
SMVVPLFVGREASVAAVNEALRSNRLIFLTAQKDPAEETPDRDDFYHLGVAAAIIRTLQLPDGRLKILAQALIKGEILEFLQEEPYIRVRIRPIKEEEPGEITVEIEALIRNVKEQGGIALGVASDEKKGYGWDMHKRKRLLRAGADILIPDFSEYDRLIKYLFCE